MLQSKMVKQKVYEIGRIAQELAEAKGIDLIPIDSISVLAGRLDDLYKSPLSLILNWAIFRTARAENSIAFEGRNDSYHIVYGGSQTYDPKKITSEGLYIETPERKIVVIRGINNHPHYIEVKDKKAYQALAGFNTMTGSPDHPLDGKYKGSAGFEDKDIPNIKGALEILL